MAMWHLLYRIGNFAGRHPWRVISAWVLVAAAAFMINMSVDGAPDESFSLPGAESQRAADAIQDRFPQETLYSPNVIFHSADGLTEPRGPLVSRTGSRPGRDDWPGGCPVRDRKERPMTSARSPLDVAIDAELVHVESSADLADADEPEREPYETRLQSLCDAVVAVEGRH
jgi:hypothetical protein